MTGLSKGPDFPDRLKPQRPNGSRRVSSFLPALALLAFSLVWSLGLTLWPQAGQPVAVFFPPALAGAPAFNAAASAGADDFLSPGGWPSVVLARSSLPDFVHRLYGQGALIVLRAPMTGCMHQD